ncbi:MAG: phosphotransferase family protein, partial [Acetobacteraceae bacterium]
RATIARPNVCGGARGMDEAARARLLAWLGVTFREPIVSADLTQLSGGAIQENWGLTLNIAGAAPQELVLRRDAPATIRSSRSREDEFRLLGLMRRAGVSVPRPVALCTDPAVLGAPFFLMQRIPGVADPRRLVGDDGLVPDRPALGAALGAELARIHAIRPPQPDFGFLGPPPGDPARARVEEYRATLDRLGTPQPAIEWVLRWLERNRPPPGPPSLLHGDYRIGNVMVDDGNIAALLDWEFCAWGDPDEDIGWFCARCWRFGRPEREAGGVAMRADFYRGYEAAAGRRIDAGQIPYWEAMAAIRWAIIALEQGARYLAEPEPSLEAALSGRMAPQLVVEAMTVITGIDHA